ncbi:DUF6572 domain-containing protein [Nocardioides plantarum]|uniref:DUF6572 domain-containing protein n=1 Tax=Nocardioides plantarum TaxID=29299 RepID=A0ABV5K920_9ACTN|nr:DUF6572 domain-containing protein [Nocardioides plantarum]
MAQESPEAGLLDPGTVDLIVEASDGVIELLIVQSYPWSGSESQIKSLQDKIHNYVGYALDGQMNRDESMTADRPWRIVVASRQGRPDVRTQKVLDTLAEVLPRYGGGLISRYDRRPKFTQRPAGGALCR